MGCRAGSQRVGGEAFAWRRGGWRRGGARVQWVGVAGLERCVEVARFSRGGLGLWWGLHAVVGLARHVGVAPWRGFRGAGWRRSRACTPCWGGVGAVSRRVLRTVTGWWQRTCAWRRGEAEVTTCVRRDGGGGGDLRGLRDGIWG